jgi:tetratricopeptide (TPR) repeat protein
MDLAFRHIILILLFIAVTNASAETQLMAEALRHFKIGDYVQTIETLKKVRGDKKIMGTKYYLMGISYNRIQEYDESVKAFKQSIANGSTTQDIWYEYGQALYAANELQMAKKVFNESAKRNFKRWTSYYYIAHISQILEEWKEAKKYYQMILDSDAADTNTTQVARFQMAETLLAMARLRYPEDKDKQSEMVSKFILPQFTKAIDVDQNSTLSKDIRSRRVEVQREFGLDPTKFKNGRDIPSDLWDVYVALDFRYDNNITFSSDTPSVQATQKDSNIVETEAYAQRKFILGRRWVISPEIQWNLTYHQDRDSTEVYSNDSYKISPAIHTKYEHKAFGDPASILLDYDYAYNARDKDAIKDMSYYASSTTWTLGWRAKLLQSGETTIKVKYKNYEAYTNTLNNTTTSLSMDHVAILPSQRILVTFFSYDDIKVELDSNSSKSYLLRFDYIIPGVYNMYTLDFAININMVDEYNNTTKTNPDISYAPSIKITKNINEHFKLDLTYEYTMNTSDDTTGSEYTKHVSGMRLKYTF